MIVICFGTFDGLHKGHLNYFKQAKKLGDYLVVVVGRDKTVEKIKKHLPIKNEKQRLQEVNKCELVDQAILGYEHDDITKKIKIIKKIKPDIICLGYDQTESEEKLQELFPNIKIFRLKSYHPEKYKSSLLNC